MIAALLVFAQVPDHTGTVDLVLWGVVSILIALIPVAGSVYLAMRATNRRLEKIGEAVNGHRDDAGEWAIEENGEPRMTLSETVRHIWLEQQEAKKEREHLVRTQQENYDHLLTLINEFGDALARHVEWEEGADGKYGLMAQEVSAVRKQITELIERQKSIDAFVIGYSGSRLPDATAVNTLVSTVDDLLTRAEGIEQASASVRELLDGIRAEMRDIEETQANIVEQQGEMADLHKEMTDHLQDHQEATN